MSLPSIFHPRCFLVAWSISFECAAATLIKHATSMTLAEGDYSAFKADVVTRVGRLIAAAGE